MSLSVQRLTGDALTAALPDVARLRMAVFRDWPYLYDGSFDYEQRYLQRYRDSPRAVLIAASDGDRVVGAATGTPLQDHAEDFAAAFVGQPYDLAEVFYCAESVLLPQYRGQGVGHRFFDLREVHAAALGFRHASFCAVQRPEEHPSRPAAYRPLDGFWRARGYAPLSGVVAHFSWRDIDAMVETRKPMQFWIKSLAP